MQLKHWEAGLATVVAILSATLGSKLISPGYGLNAYNHQVFPYNEENLHRVVHRQSLQPAQSPSLLHSFLSGLKQTFLNRLPAERQAGLAGLSSTIQAAAIPMAVAGIVAANREQIASALEGTTAKTTTTTTKPDLCKDITCSGASNACDDDTGLCVCGTAGACSGTSNWCDAGTCKCADTGAACSTATMPFCLLKTDQSVPAGTVTDNTASCQCSSTSCTTDTAPFCGNANSNAVVALGTCGKCQAMADGSGGNGLCAAAGGGTTCVVGTCGSGKICCANGKCVTGSAGADGNANCA